MATQMISPKPISPIGDVDCINELSSLFSQKKTDGDLQGFSFLVDSVVGVTAGEIAGEISTVYSDYIDGKMVDVTDQLMSGAF